MRVIHEVPLAERIERVLPSGMELAREGERVVDLRVVAEFPEPAARELEVEELDVELGVVDEDLGAGNEVEELLGHLREFRSLPQILEGQAVHPGRAEVDVALRIQVRMEVPLADPPG